MTLKREQETFQVLLTNRFHQEAQRFYQHHTDTQKAKQVYLNVLSVQAVKFYLTCLGLKTDLEQSESWNPVLHVLADIADLWVDGWGRLECRPVLPDQSDLEVPLEVLSDRIGYVFVQFNAELTESTLIGFLSQLEKERIPLTQLQPIDGLPTYLSQLPQLPQRLIQTGSTSWVTRVALRPWLNQAFEAGWTRLEQLVANWQTQQPAFNFRTPLAKLEHIEPAITGVKQGKFLSLGELPEEEVLLIVGIAPGRESLAFNITVELYPTGSQAYLPPALQLIVMDEAHIPVLQAEGRQSEGLEFQFSGEPGECFNIQINLNQLTLVESFEI